MNEQDTKKYFLFGTIGLGVLIVAGLFLAILSGPGPGGQQGSRIQGLNFNDDNDPAYGSEEPTGIVRIFSDFQCPACKDAEPALAAAMKKYGDRVRFVWDDFPLTTMHQNALPAALAARCAEDQGKFWEYHDRLYAEQDSWSPLPAPTDTFLNYAKDLGLDGVKFSSCLMNRQFLSKIKDDENEGKAAGIEGTPTYFVGDRKFVGGMDIGAWDAALGALLQGS